MSAQSMYMYVYVMWLSPFSYELLPYSAVMQMILHNPESAKITNDYLYNILHIAALNNHRDIISIAIEKVIMIWSIYVCMCIHPAVALVNISHLLNSEVCAVLIEPIGMMWVPNWK